MHARARTDLEGVSVARPEKDRAFRIIVQGRHLDVTAALKDYAEEKLGKIARHFDQIQEAQVVLSVERRGNLGKAQVVEVTVWGDGIVLRGEEASADMYASIDRVVEKLKKQIEKYRSRVIQKRRIDEARRRNRRRASAQAALHAGPDQPNVVRIKRFAMKPMTPEDAAMQMELLGHDFFAFRNAQTLEVNVLYRRTDGHYGLIEPES